MESRAGDSSGPSRSNRSTRYKCTRTKEEEDMIDCITIQKEDCFKSKGISIKIHLFYCIVLFATREKRA